MFEVSNSEDFSFSLPVDQQIAFYMYSYVQEDTTFVRVNDVRKESPVTLSIYELDPSESPSSAVPVDFSKLIIKNGFFYQKYIVFNGHRHAQYLLRFQTTGRSKLVSMSMKLFV